MSEHIYLRSIVEATEIGVDAVKLMATESLQWLGSKVARLDEWLADYGDNPQ